jgi:hypothetical protein
MALVEIRFDKGGGPLTVEVVFGHVQVGAYALALWDKKGRRKRKIGEGINTDQVADTYTLRQPISENNGAIIDCMATVLGGNTGPTERYRVDMIVSQGGVECGRQSEEGILGSQSISTRLAARLTS